jgi:hypothetical protein
LRSLHDQAGRGVHLVAGIFKMGHVA